MADMNAIALMLLPESVEEALAGLAMPGAVAVAVASWVLRGGLRGEIAAPVWVVLGAIAEMHTVAPH